MYATERLIPMREAHPGPMKLIAYLWPSSADAGVIRVANLLEPAPPQTAVKEGHKVPVPHPIRR